MNEQFQQKLLNYAPEPPAGTWNSISNALNETLSSSSFPALLHDFEARPPEDTWNKIETQLSIPAGKIIPLTEKRKTSPLKRYIAAAVIFLIAASSIIFWNMDDIVPASTTQHSPVEPAPLSPGIVPEPSTNTTSAPATIALQPAVQNKPLTVPAANRQATASLKENAGRTANNIAIRPRANTSSLLNLSSFFPNKIQPKKTAVSSLPEEKYMVYSDDEGHAMRVSKKLINFFVCVKEEIICQQEKRQLEQRMASYTTTNDFAGIIELLRILKENQ
jgi:hypothetical protein